MEWCFFQLKGNKKKKKKKIAIVFYCMIESTESLPLVFVVQNSWSQRWSQMMYGGSLWVTFPSPLRSSSARKIVGLWLIGKVFGANQRSEFECSFLVKSWCAWLRAYFPFHLFHQWPNIFIWILVCFAQKGTDRCNPALVTAAHLLANHVASL